MLLFFENGQFKQIGKNHFFQKQKIEIDFSNLYILGKL